MAYLPGVDVSWPQGNYVPAPGHQFVGVGAVSADGGKPFVQSTYHQQVSNAHAAGKPVLHYAFNGRYDPAALANYLMDNLFDFRPGDGIALDVESSEKGTYPAYSPAQGAAFTNQIAARRGITTQVARVAIYGPIAEMTKAGWGALEKAGCWLWLAWPGAESKIRLGEWSAWTMWQYTVSGGVDQDYTKIPLQQIVGAAPTTAGDGDMYSLTHDATSAAVWVCALGAPYYTQVANPYHLSLLQRYRVGDPGMLPVERDICIQYLRVIYPAQTPVPSVAPPAPTPWDPTAEDLAAIAAGVKLTYPDLTLSLTGTAKP